jgi:ABC-type Zn uptake system ZnuABC Zn-binding protein ZnuA
VQTRPDGDEVDPHWWQDPHNAETAVAEIEKALSAADPDGAAAYARNAEAYTAKLTALDRAVAACIDRIPAAERKLVTTHDALGYYADRYGLEVVGAVIPAITTQAQASAGEVDELVDTIEREQVKAIFAESSVNPKLEQLIADQSGATVGKALWADTLGPEGSDGDTYLKSIASNTRAIADGLGGGAVSCTLPD